MRRFLIISISMLFGASSVWAVDGTIDKKETHVCNLADGGACYDPGLPWPEGATVCDTFNKTDGTCSLGSVSGSVGLGGLVSRSDLFNNRPNIQPTVCPKGAKVSPNGSCTLIDEQLFFGVTSKKRVPSNSGRIKSIKR